tara:strand:- start:310 stop:894 length:585 start_codon:yes stop_codon:yes gene_type:complete
MSSKYLKLLGYLAIIIFILLFVTMDGESEAFKLVYVIPLISVLLFQKAQVASIKLDLLDDESVIENVRHAFGAWCFWSTNKRLVLYFPTGPKKGFNKFLTSMARKENPEENKIEPYGYFLSTSNNIDEVFSKETGFLSINIKDINSIETFEEKIGIKKWSMRRIKMNNQTTIVNLHLPSTKGKKLRAILDSIKL